MSLRYALLTLLCCTPALADVRLHPFFADHMVLQQGDATPIWGKADAGEKVVVSIAGQKRETTAAADGTWRIDLASLKAGGPYELVVRGKNVVTLKDVYIGEVWLCSGQSNMDFTVGKTQKRSFAGVKNEAEEVAAANEPMIRALSLELSLAETPQKEFVGTWQVCSPDTVKDISAVAYFFARELRRHNDVPVGLVISAYGASTAQAWISDESLRANPQLASMIPDYERAVADFKSGAAQAKYEQALKEWEAASEKAKADGKPAPRKPGAPKDPSKDQHNPRLLYNGMIEPLRPAAFRGAIWYQGESNGYNNELYLTLMQTLIADWRAKFGREFPFLFVQLANYKAPATQPAGRSQIASVREAQRLTLDVPKTAMAVTLDIGDAKDVHPRNKQDVGLRLATAARAVVYGEAIDYSGPLFQSAAVEGNAIRVKFKHANGLRVGKGDKLEGFAMLASGKWAWADARIDGDDVLVTVPAGATAEELRYAWADNPPNNLTNATGFPASSFRVELRKP
jgi:sialate O-acetylesterase